MIYVSPIRLVDGSSITDSTIIFPAFTASPAFIFTPLAAADLIVGCNGKAVVLHNACSLVGVM